MCKYYCIILVFEWTLQNFYFLLYSYFQNFWVVTHTTSIELVDELSFMIYHFKWNVKVNKNQNVITNTFHENFVSGINRLSQTTHLTKSRWCVKHITGSCHSFVIVFCCRSYFRCVVKFLVRLLKNIVFHH